MTNPKKPIQTIKKTDSFEQTASIAGLTEYFLKNTLIENEIKNQKPHSLYTILSNLGITTFPNPQTTEQIEQAIEDLVYSNVQNRLTNAGPQVPSPLFKKLIPLYKKYEKNNEFKSTITAIKNSYHGPYGWKQVVQFADQFGIKLPFNFQDDDSYSAEHLTYVLKHEKVLYKILYANNMNGDILSVQILLKAIKKVYPKDYKSALKELTPELDKASKKYKLLVKKIKASLK